MCEINARCPNCGRDDLDDHELACTTINDTHRREYACPCGARVLVVVEAAVQ